jgi:rod shape determining protein RodA
VEGRIWRDVHFLLLLCVLVLLSISLLSVYSATLEAVTAFGTPLKVLFPRHIINITIGLVAMTAMMVLDYRTISGIAGPLYLGTVVVLAGVLVIGEITSGAQSWIGIGTRTVQPSEFSKLTVIIVLAAYWSHFEDQSNRWLTQFGSLGLVGIPLLMVMLQPDFGTALVFGAIWVVMAWESGIRWQQLVFLLVLALPCFLVGWEYVLNEEQRARLSTFYWLIANPAEVNADEAYNIIQSLNAIRSGGLFGTGLTRGILSQGNYIPVQYSDFIFAVIGEEMGFVGGVLLLVLQALLLWMVLSIASRARDRFGRLIAVGIFGMILAHVMVNVGVTMSIMPVTGIPLPFISYGGSFTIMILAAIGLLQSIAMHRRKIVF